MSGGLGGLGTSGNTFNSNTSSNSQTAPFGPTLGGLQNYIGQNNQALGLAAAPLQAMSDPNSFNYQLASAGNNNLGKLQRFGGFGQGALGLAQQGGNYIKSQGDPYGILGNIQNSIGNLNNPAASPGMQGVLNTIQQDTENAVNSQFAGAGRSMSGLNSQALARGLAQGESQPLLNQYNQNIQNLMGVGNARTQNLAQGGQLMQGAPGIGTAVPSAELNWQQQYTTNPMQNIGAAENLLLPIAGLGGSATGTQQTVGQGTQTASPLSQIGSGLGILGSGVGLLGGLGLL